LKRRIKMLYKLKYGHEMGFDEGDLVRIVIRSELYKAPNESELVYNGRITEIEEGRGFWYVDDDNPQQEEFLAFEDVESVLVRE
jgi:hypothetical protein